MMEKNSLINIVISTPTAIGIDNFIIIFNEKTRAFSLKIIVVDTKSNSLSLDHIAFIEI